jgi:Uma2 family endonuclease
VIVVEVLSPGTRHIGNAAKLEGYFALLSVFHYLIVDTEKRVVIHHARGDGDLLKTRIVRSGKIELDPPGLTIEFDACFNAG